MSLSSRRSSYASPGWINAANTAYQTYQAFQANRRHVDRAQRIATDLYSYAKRKVPRLPPINTSISTMGGVVDGLAAGTASGRNLHLKKCRPRTGKIDKMFKAKVLASIAPRASISDYTVKKFGHLNRSVSPNLYSTADRIYVDAANLQSQNGSVAVEQSMDFFTPAKVLDAASVLFNGKESDINYALTTNNFNNVRLKVEIPFMSASLQFNNQTQIFKKIRFYECIPKFSTEDQVSAKFISALVDDPANIAGATNATYGVSPFICGNFMTQYTVKKREFTMPPGTIETIVLTNSNVCYDYEKFINNTTNTFWTFPKGHAVCCFYQVENVEVLPVPGASGPFVGHSSIGVLSGSNLRAGVMCEITEYYKIEAPELTEDAFRYKKYVKNCYKIGSAPWSQNFIVGTTANQFSRIDRLEPVVPIVAPNLLV